MTTDPCEACERAVADGLRDKQDCETCTTAWLDPGNETAWEICQTIRNGLIVRHSEETKAGTRIYRAVHWPTIEAAIKIFSVPEWQRVDMVRKIMAFAAVLIEHDLREASQ